MHEVVSGERDRIMDDMRVKADLDARKIGVQIVDVRLKRVDLPTRFPSRSIAAWRPSASGRQRAALPGRCRGRKRSRPTPTKQREVIVAEAYRQAQIVKGEGDAKASAIYAQAFGQSPEFYAFYRSLEAYRNSFKNKSDVMVVEPNTEFFKYLKGPVALGGGVRRRQGCQEHQKMGRTLLLAFALMLVLEGSSRSWRRPPGAKPSAG